MSPGLEHPFYPSLLNRRHCAPTAGKILLLYGLVRQVLKLAFYNAPATQAEQLKQLSARVLNVYRVCVGPTYVASSSNGYILLYQYETHETTLGQT